MCGVVSRAAHDAAAWMATRAAQEQTGYWRLILSGFVGRPHHEHLIHRKFGVMPVATGHSIALL